VLGLVSAVAKWKLRYTEMFAAFLGQPVAGSSSSLLTLRWLDRVITTGSKPELTHAAVDATLEKMARRRYCRPRIRFTPFDALR
jgi:hypothetical protein